MIARSTFITELRLKRSAGVFLCWWCKPFKQQIGVFMNAARRDINLVTTQLTADQQQFGNPHKKTNSLCLSSFGIINSNHYIS